MKRKVLLLLMILSFSAILNCGKLMANPIYWENGKYFGVNAGWTRLGLNAGTFDVAIL